MLAISPPVPTFEIQTIRPYESDSTLYCDVDLDYLLDEKSAETLTSGLPIRFYFNIRLASRGSAAVYSKKYGIQIQYDVWDETFAVNQNGVVRIYKSIDDVRARLKKIDKIGICPTKDLDPQAEYSLKLRLNVYQIGDERSRLFWDWINSNVEESNEPAQKTSFGLGSIIRFFFGSGQETPKHTAWKESATFMESALPKQ